MNEAETRAEYIDPKLKDAGWGVVEGSKILREYHITAGKKGGGIAKRARLELEEKAGKRVISGGNYLPPKSSKKLRGK
jgi:hypothetical protein